MRYQIHCESTVDGDVESIWDVWSDMTSYPEWDPREAELRLDGPFRTGTTGFSRQVGRRPGSPFTLTLVEPMSRWDNECPLPGGKLVMTHRLESAGRGRVRLQKTYQVCGPLSVLFRFHYGREIRRQLPETFAALAAEAARRQVHAAG